jgi:hypothetical protein
MSDQPFVPLSHRFSGQDVEDAVPYEGVPDHLKYPLRDWLSNVLASEQGRSSLNRRVAVLLRLRVLTSLEGAANYAAMIFRATADSESLSLDIIDGILQLHPYRPVEVDSPWALAVSNEVRSWSSDVDELAEMLADGGSAYEVNSSLSGLERRVDPTVREAFSASVSLAESIVGRERAADRLRRAWASAYGLHPDPSAAVHDAVRAVEAVLIPIAEPKNASATLGTVLGKFNDPNFAARWRLSLSQNRGGDEDGPGPLLGLLRVIWHNHRDRHEGSSPAPEVGREVGQAVVHAAACVVQWLLLGLLELKSEAEKGRQPLGDIEQP